VRVCRSLDQCQRNRKERCGALELSRREIILLDKERSALQDVRCRKTGGRALLIRLS